MMMKMMMKRASGVGGGEVVMVGVVLGDDE